MRPLSLSIFNMDCNEFRKQWLLYDILQSKTIGINPSLHPSIVLYTYEGKDSANWYWFIPIALLLSFSSVLLILVGILDGCLFKYGSPQREALIHSYQQQQYQQYTQYQYQQPHPPNHIATIEREDSSSHREVIFSPLYLYMFISISMFISLFIWFYISYYLIHLIFMQSRCDLR